MKYTYPACFYKEEDGRYSVEMPDFPLATFGNDLADAMYMAADAATGWILTALTEGDPVPPASNIKDIKPDDETGFVSLVYIDFDAMKANFDESAIKKTLTIPSWLNKAAERKNINFSATLKDALIYKLSQ
jgi:predicted RNase H-like HicB family nuclease